MPNYSKKIVYLTDAQRQELFTNNTVTVNGVTINYDENDIYVTPQAEPITDVKINGTSIGSNGVANIPISTSSTFGVTKGYNQRGININGSGEVSIYAATEQQCKQQTGSTAYQPITVYQQHSAAFYGLATAAGDTTQKSSSNAVGVYTDNAKSSIQNMLGITNLIASEEAATATAAHAASSLFMMDGKLMRATTAVAIGDAVAVGTNCEVTNIDGAFTHDVQVDGTSVVSNGVATIPIAVNAQYGLIKPYGAYGVGIRSNGFFGINPAETSVIKAGENTNYPIVPSHQHEATFYGLAKAAGDTTQALSENAVGTYTTTAAAAIRSMIGVEDLIKVSDTTPTTDATKLWLTETAPTGIQVPTYTEFTEGLAGKVSDVQINGTSIVSSNIATLPVADSSTLGLVSVRNGSDGLQLSSTSPGRIMISSASSSAVKSGASNYSPIVPLHQHEATFYGLATAAGDTTQKNSSNAVGTYTETAKSAIQHMLGTDTIIAPNETELGYASQAYAIGDVFTMNGKLYEATAAIAANDVITVETNCAVTDISSRFPHDVQVDGTSVLSNGVASIPYANDSTFGVVKVSSGLTVTSTGSLLRTIPATTAQIKAGQRNYEQLVPSTQHYSVFYGLSKVAGVDLANETVTLGTYPATSKAAIQQMLGVETGVSLVETVSGSTPSITGQPNVRYRCGEVSTLSITPPNAGTIDVVFTSGSTATVLTVPNTVKFPSWFDVTSLDADTIYEIMITDATYGAVMTWAN